MRDAGLPLPLLEVIALTADDAVAAQSGGADRLEVVSEIGVGGLTPALEEFIAIRDAVDLPLRVMLRTNGGLRITPRELDGLLAEIERLRDAGADQFVCGFLDASDALDLPALRSVCAATAPRPWTLHHAFDHARDQRAAWEDARALPRLDCVLSGGVRGDLGRGLQTLCSRAGWQLAGPRWLAGGGLVLGFVPALLEVGVRSFHIGRAARVDRSWRQPVSPAAVRRWRELLDRNQS